MERSNDMPLWVFLGLMNVETRNGALILVYLMIICFNTAVMVSR